MSDRGRTARADFVFHQMSAADMPSALGETVPKLVDEQLELSSFFSVEPISILHLRRWSLWSPIMLKIKRGGSNTPGQCAAGRRYF